MNVKDTAARAAGDAVAAGAAAGKSAQQHPAMKALVSIGIVAFGLVHLVVGWIALQIAWGGSGSGDSASKNGALAQLAKTPVGTPLLWVLGIGLIALALWQLMEAAWGFGHVEQGRKRTVKRLAALGKTVVFAGLAVAAIKIAVDGAGKASGGSSGDKAEQGMTAKLLAAPFGRILVVVVGLAIIGAGIASIVKGVKKKFVDDDLAGSVSPAVERLGQAGFIAKGAATAVIGGLFGWAALSYDPQKAGGLDDALRTLRDAPAGSVLLTLVALGFVCFGIYCFFWARSPRR